jgi:D-glycero-alpha-D-manno-heptose-7-phosphate kinase
MSRTVTVRAPTRLDFGGGWTDVPPYAEEAGGFVCNVAISRYATVRVTSNDESAPASPAGPRGAEHALVDAVARHLRVHDANIRLSSDFPLGAGLGGSSAAGVAAVAALSAWQGKTLALDELAETSRTVETDELGIAGGRQDHYAAAYGGALALRFGQHVNVSRIALDASTADELARRCLLIYTGQSRISGDTIVGVLSAYRTGDAGVVGAMKGMRELAEKMPAALERADFDCLGQLVAEQWIQQRALHPRISTPRIDAIVAAASLAGAIGAKALGASGGGCVLVIAQRDRVDDVRDAIAPLGDVLPYRVDTAGVTPCA